MSETATIRTNNVPRNLIDGSELSAKEREEFDYLDWTKLDAGTDSASFFRFKGEVYDLGTFMRTEQGGDFQSKGWIGYAADSAFSGTLVRYTDDNERVVVGTYYC